MNAMQDDSKYLFIPVSRERSEWLMFDEAGTGWAKVLGVDAVDQLYVRIGSGWVRHSELLIQEVLAQAGRISNPTMRRVPLAQVKAAINRPTHYDLIVQHLSGERRVMVPFPADEKWSAEPPAGPADPIDLRLDIPAPRSHKPDSFYADVAERFAYQSTISARPTLDLVEANGVEFTTMVRWVREARNRGLLPKTGRSNRSAG